MKTFIQLWKRKIKKITANVGIIKPFHGSFKEIEFETTTFCNRKCVYCPDSKYKRVGAEDGRYMKEEVFEKLLKDISAMGFKGMIAPHLYGEPLTDPRLVDWVSKIRKILPHAIIKIVTNGDYLNENKYTELINAGVDFFCISKHSPELPKGVVAILNKLNKKEQLKKMRILDYYEDYHNKQTMLNTRGGDIHLKKKLKHQICCQYVLYPVVNTFGDVILCCNDFHSRYVSGNIMDRPLLEIWQDPKNIHLRTRIYKGRFDLPICQNCQL